MTPPTSFSPEAAGTDSTSGSPVHSIGTGVAINAWAITSSTVETGTISNRRYRQFPPDKGGKDRQSPSDKGGKDRQFPPDKGGKGGYIPYNKTLTEKARKNRKNPTPAEQKLWHEVLQSKRLDNLKFTRQKPLDEYIVDFYCAKLMLAIEIDGDTHAGQKQYDEDRTKNLNKFGVEVIRYTNAEVLNNLEGVYQDLHKRISARKPPKSPLSGGLDNYHP